MLRFSVNFEDESWAVRQNGDLVLTRPEQDDALDAARVLVYGIKAAGGDAALVGYGQDRDILVQGSGGGPLSA